MSKSRNLRLVSAGLLLAAAGAILLPRATSYVSTSAVVNAPLITVRSPFDGRIAQASPEVAHVVSIHDALVRIDGDRTDRSHLTGLLAEEASLLREQRSLDGERDALREIAASLRELDRQHRAHRLRLLNARLTGFEAEHRGALAEVREVRDRMARTRSLAAKGNAPHAMLERETAEFAIKRAEADRLKAQTEALRVSFSALNRGIVVEEVGGDVSYAHQRLDEIAIRLADLATETSRTEARRDALAVQIVQARADLDANKTFLPEAATTAVVWRASAAVGNEVMAGDEIVKLVDCGRRFIEVAISERHFETIAPGTRAQVRLRGSAERFEARVEAVKGAGAKSDHAELSSEQPFVPEGQLRVFVGLEPADLAGAGAEGTAAAFCDVGRTAEVRFTRSVADDLRLCGLGIPFLDRSGEGLRLFGLRLPFGMPKGADAEDPPAEDLARMHAPQTPRLE